MARLRKYLFLFIPLIVVVGCASNLYYYTQSTPKEKKISTIAVIPFDAGKGRENSSAIATDVFNICLLEKGYNIVAPGVIEAYFKKKTMSINGLTEESSKEMGKALNVEAIITGNIFINNLPGNSITELEVSDYLFKIHNYEIPRRIKTGITARLIDTSTGKIIWVGSYARSSGKVVRAYKKICKAITKSMETKIQRLYFNALSGKFETHEESDEGRKDKLPDERELDNH